MRHFSTTEHTAIADVQLTDAERQPCEVWTRVMGYHRPVSSFNIASRASTTSASSLPNRLVAAEPGSHQPLQGVIRAAATAAPSLRVGGLTPLTSIDFPDRLAAVLYCQGCPWRCGYCHNPELLDASTPAALPWPQVLAFLESRRGLLDGVVCSGGEPTLQAALPSALAEVRALGFQTALHTGGMYPERLSAALPLLDWVGLDIKGPLHAYDAITGTPGSGAKAFESLHRLLASGVAHECRTTWHAGLFGVDGLFALADMLADAGVAHWALQECRAPGVQAWELTAQQTAHLGARFAGFLLRRG